MSTLERAIEIALDAHRGQADKGGDPYILHPLRIMIHMRTEAERIVAVLHDVVEDSAWTFEALVAEGFTSEVMSALEALTKRDGEDRISAALRAVRNPIARAVKLADNTDNSDLSRIPHPAARDFDRLEQYRQVRLILEQGGGAGQEPG